MSVLGTKPFDAAHDSQRVFRCVLQATAQPGKLFTLPPTEAPPHEAVALTLLDHEVTFCAVGEESEELEGRVAGLSGSRVVAPSGADFVFILGGAGISGLKRGDLERPEGGATAIYAVENLSNAGPLALRLSGPGVPDGRTLGVEGLPRDEAGAIRESRAGYPLGVDVYLVDGAGRVAGLPRSTRLEVL